MLAVVILAGVACKSSDPPSDEQPTDEQPADEDITECDPCGDAYELTARFTRGASSQLSPIVVHARLTNHGIGVAGATLTLESSRGTVGAVSDGGGGDYTATITPAGTGEYAITVSFAELTVRRVALVLEHVSDTWDQPMVVDGLVNTAGYEDGANVTSDGAYLFVHYGPIYFSGLILASFPRASGGCGGLRLDPDRCTHPWIDTTIGPFAAPERPGFFVGRIDTATGALRHNSNLYGLGDDEAPIVAAVTMFYGFHRQPDGSYAEPFYVAFDDAQDAIANPFGLHVVPPNIAVFAQQDTQTRGVDVFTTPLTLGQNTILGTYTPGSPPQRGTPFASTRLAFGDTGTEGTFGTQGNPMMATDSTGAVWAVFTDDEFDSGNEEPLDDDDADGISAFVHTGAAFPDGTWTKVILPSVVNDPSAAENQPFLDSDGYFYFRRDNSLMRNRFDGARNAVALADAASWTVPSVELAPAPTSNVGDILAVGEPSVAVIDGKRVLFFVYGRIRAVGDPSGFPDLDMQIGMVEQR
ncbi:MAG: Ig-like domain-containing protein [Myxococcota bacterium]